MISSEATNPLGPIPELDSVSEKYMLGGLLIHEPPISNSFTNALRPVYSTLQNFLDPFSL